MPWIDLNLDNDQMQEIEEGIATGRTTVMDLKDIISQEISNWEASDELKWMQIGQKYYRNQTDILDRVRTAVGESGALEPVANLANNKLANAFTRKLVDQKVGYLLSKQISIQTDDLDYQEKLEPYFDRKFMRLLQSLGAESINKGIAWLHVYIDDFGAMRFMKIPSEQCIPIWSDAAHTELQAMIRYYQVEVYEGKEKKDYTKVEWWDSNGVRRYVQDGSDLIPDAEYMRVFERSIEGHHFNDDELNKIEAGISEGRYPHVIVNVDGESKSYSFEKVPFIAFKYNDDEIPLIGIIKSLVDDYDRQKSDNANNLEDLPNSIYVVKNYGNTKAGEFRKNISQYRLVFTEGDGGVGTVSIPIETEAYKIHQEQNRKDIYEFGRGVDTQADNFGNASGVALKFLYADLDLDCNIIENHFQAGLEQLEWFIDLDLMKNGQGDFFGKEVEFIFNRDIMINETEAITNIRNSVDILSDETLIAQHPWVTKAKTELDRREKQRKKRLKDYPGFGDQPTGDEE